jgi:hypothetical protein
VICVLNKMCADAERMPAMPRASCPARAAAGVARVIGVEKKTCANAARMPAMARAS